MDDNQSQDQQTSNTLPDDLAALSPEQLEDALASAKDEAKGIRETPQSELTDEQVDRLEVLANFVDSVATQKEANEQAAADRAARAEAAGARLDGDGGEGGDSDGGSDDGDKGEDEPQPSEQEQPEAVAAAAEQIATAIAKALTAGAGPAAPSTSVAARARQPRNPQPAGAGSDTPVMAMVAAADVGDGINAGQKLDGMPDLVRAFVSKSKAFPKSGRPAAGVRHQFNVAQIERNHMATADGLTQSNEDYKSDLELLTAATKESRLPGGSLVAAGGWCAPSETLYGLTSNETLDGIIDLPTVGVSRGGINYTPGPDFGDIFTTAGFVQTEAEAIAGTEKNCVEVDCPDFTEVRLDAVGICVKAPLLTRAAYPEVIARWLDGTVVANQHKVAARLITAMRTALGTALAPTLTGTPVTWSTLTALELIGEGQRQAYRLSENETLEVIAPRWLRIAIRGDLANRMGIGAESVTNAQIQQHFADRGLAVQWVLNYLELSSPLTNVAFPATAEVMVYPAGTFVKGTADVISLDTVYDTADLQTNVYTAAFVEDGVLLAKMQHGGKRITLPVNVTGLLGAAQLDDNWGTAQAETTGAAPA